MDREHSRLQSMGLPRTGHNGATNTLLSLFHFLGSRMLAKVGRTVFI